MSIEDILSGFEHGIIETASQWSFVDALEHPLTVASPAVPHDEAFMTDLLTPATPQAVYDALGRVSYGLGHDSRLVLLSQWCLETGGGKSCHRWNIGNVKHLRGDGHAWTMFGGVTEVLGGRVQRFEPPDPQTWFRAFSTLDAGATDYLAILRTRFASAWPAVLAGDPAAFGHALAVQHYYTSPEQAYVTVLVRLRGELEAQIVDGDPADSALG